MVQEMVEVGVEFEEEPELDDEVGMVKPSEVSEVVLHSTDWTAETLLSQLDRENIDLNPRFQRRDAWTLGRKSRFIESLILGLPVPEIVLAERKGERGRYVVLDGKQRLLTLLQFTGRGQTRNNNFALRSLEVREDLNGKRFSDFEENLALRADLDALYNQTIRTVVIRNWPDPTFLRIVFLRLNTSSVPLSPQELRQALFPGPFVDFIDDKASESEVIKGLLGIQEPDFRMRDTELLLRFLALHYFLPQYDGNLKTFLDSTCRILNGKWNEMEEDIRHQAAQYEDAIRAAARIFGEENVGRKWAQDKFERRINRAVLDVEAFYLSTNPIRECAIENAQVVLQAFKELCTRDEAFRTSVEATTKSLQATYTRLSLWGASLAGVLPIALDTPAWDEGRHRIVFEGFVR